MATVADPFLLNTPSLDAKLGPPLLLSTTERAAQQYSHLASQHHRSEYNCLKFGRHGSSVRYIPLSIQAPEHFRGLQLRQLQWTDVQPWWPNQTVNNVTPANNTITLGPCGNSREPVDISRELSVAMEDTLPIQQNLLPSSVIESNHPIKTSVTHPISVSTIIPPEYLSLISSHVLLVSSPPSAASYVPTTLEVPPAFALDRLVPMYHHGHPPEVDVATCVSSLQSNIPVETVINNLRSRAGVPEAISLALHTEIPAVSFRDPVSESPVPSTPPDSPSTQPGIVVQSPTLPTLHPNGSRASLSLSLDLATSTSFYHVESVKDFIADTLPFARSAPAVTAFIPDTFLPSSIPPTFDDDAVDPNGKEFFTHPSLELELEPEVHFPSILQPQSFQLGNLLMSSCPGKKVRLQGPVKGRSGVYRDLYTDIRRMKDMGVGCIVCCLDDEELAYLGSPWPEYEQVTRQLEMDVLRLPTPEGLPPSVSPAAIDDILTTIIENYTLRGISILVHCRGGVGRAGVFACCWMLRLGLCGWVDSDPFRTSPSPSWINPEVPYYPGFTTHVGVHGPADMDTLRLVEKAIMVLRRRRSVKGIETFEQVKFLVEFVDYLRTKY